MGRILFLPDCHQGVLPLHGFNQVFVLGEIEYCDLGNDTDYHRHPHHGGDIELDSGEPQADEDRRKGQKRDRHYGNSDAETLVEIEQQQEDQSQGGGDEHQAGRGKRSAAAGIARPVRNKPRTEAFPACAMTLFTSLITDPMSRPLIRAVTATIRFRFSLVICGWPLTETILATRFKGKRWPSGARSSRSWRSSVVARTASGIQTLTPTILTPCCTWVVTVPLR